MARKRSNGTGTVYQRADGRWVAAVIVDGERVSRYRKSRKEAELALAQLLADGPSCPTPRNGTNMRHAPITLAQWVDQWLAASVTRLRPKTLSDYRKALKPAVEAVSATALTDLTPLRLGELLTTLHQQGRGARSIQQTYTVLRTCLEGAVDMDLLKANPMARVPKPRWQAQEKRYWTIEETRRFIDVALASKRKWSALCAFLLATGLRISEAYGLTWGDVDLDTRRVRVRQPQVYVEGEFHAGPPKSKAGRRWVALDRVGLRALQKLQAGHEHAGVFRTRGGRPPTPEVVNRELRRLCIEADVPMLNPHGLRHVQAMLALEATGDAYAVQRRLGHSHVNVTLGIYGYSKRREDEMSAHLDCILMGSDSTLMTRSGVCHQSS